MNCSLPGRMCPCRRWFPSNCVGAAMLEFAIAVPVLFLLIFGVIDIGMVLARRTILTGALHRAGLTTARVPQLSSTACRQHAEEVFEKEIAGYAGFGAVSQRSVSFTFDSADGTDAPRTVRASLQAKIPCMLFCGVLAPGGAGRPSEPGYNFSLRYDFVLEDRSRCVSR